jgi:arylsulfatase A-like enzyme
MIVLTSDHGEEFFEHGSWLHTHSVYNEVMRVPLIIKNFGSRGAGTSVATYVREVDVMPTICRELGIGIKPDSIDGRSLQELEGGASSARARIRVAVGDLSAPMVHRNIPPKIAILRFPYKFIFNSPYSKEDLAYFQPPPPPLAETEIFDLARDRGETANLAAERPDLVREFRKLMKQLYMPRKGPGARKSATNGELEKQLKTLGYL